MSEIRNLKEESTVKFVAEKNWGSHPSNMKTLPGFSNGYSYYDYVEAWFKLQRNTPPR